jgi:hypothetical protein
VLATAVLLWALADPAVSGALGDRPAIEAQTPLDRILFRFGNDIVTWTDVRQARLLKLVEVGGDADQAYVDAIVDRRLLLADLQRAPAAEPASGAIDAAVRQWQARLGPGADVASLLAAAGMTDAGLRAWVRDDLRIQTYLAERFAGSSDRAGDTVRWIATLRQRAGIAPR